MTSGGSGAQCPFSDVNYRELHFGLRRFISGDVRAAAGWNKWWLSSSIFSLSVIFMGKKTVLFVPVLI
jgi:hypothetical protein